MAILQKIHYLYSGNRAYKTERGGGGPSQSAEARRSNAGCAQLYLHGQSGER
jgi:hypothetical protein